MELIRNEVRQIFNQEEIRPGCLLYARHETWESGQAGFVTCVTETELQVQYHPGIRNVTNHFRLPVAEVEAGEWEVRWSQDLKLVGEILMKGENAGDAGGADL